MASSAKAPSQVEQVFGTAEILNVIMKYCDQDGKKCLHYLNKKIYEDSMEYWRENMVARIGWCNCFETHPHFENYKQAKDGICRRETHVLTAYTEQIAKDPPLLKLRTLPYQNLKLAKWNFRVLETNQTITFWPNVSPQVRTLMIDVGYATRQSMWGNDFFQKFPNLESFTIKDISFPMERMMQQDRSPHTYVCENLRSLKLSCASLKQADLVNLFRHCYRLEEFTVEKEKLLLLRRNYGTVRVLREILEAINEARNLPEITAANGLNIRSLNFMNVHEPALRCCSYYRELFKFQQLVRIRLPLRYITLDIPVRATALAGCNVMSPHQTTLEVAELFRCPTDEPIWSFACGLNMNYMRKLVLWGAIASNFGFLKSMPNLKYLKIQRSCYDKQYKVKSVLADRYYLNFNSCYVENTKKAWSRTGDTREDGTPVGANLEYFEVDFEFQKKSVKAISRWMPNLKEIKFVVNEDALKIIAKRWENLEALTMFYGSTLYNHSVGDDLVKLKKLHSFTLQTKCGESMLSDECVRDGFLQMENLKNLDICVSPSMSLLSSCLLEEHVKNLKIRRNYGPDHKDFCCAYGEFERSINLPTKMETMSLRSRNVDFPSHA